MHRLFRSVLVVVLFAIHTCDADDIDLEVHSGIVLKMLRDMANKTNASESLNLPANASSIRENITDTFSCENRTYGYYADVDNECQIFHVCLPSQNAAGRNLTYRWSFICPKETVFNQVVLTCTRPPDSIPCEESPDYYELNNEIGKVPPRNDSKQTDKDTKHKPENERERNEIQYSRDRNQFNDRNRVEYNRNEKVQIERDREGIRKAIMHKRGQDNKKQNIILDKLFTEIVDEEIKEQLQNVDIDDGETVKEIFPEVITDEALENEPEATDNKEEIAMTNEDVEERLALERMVADRRSFRFIADV